MAYVVKKGDNLTKIAKQNGLSLTKLLELNKQIKNPDYIQIGQKINLTNSSPTGKKIYDNNDGYPITPKNIPPSWNKVTKGAGNPTTSAKFKKPVKENKDEIIKYYIDEMIKSGNKKIFITDKGTKKTYYGNASDYNGDLKSLNSFDVLTGVNDDPNFYKYDDTSVDDIDKSQNPSIHKVTPIGKYSLIYDQIYNKPGFRLPNTSIAYHTIYPGELENRKSKLLSQTPNDNNVSYGCINCNEPDIQKVSKFLNSGDSTYIIDSRLPLDKLKSILNPKNNKSGKIETEKKSTNKVIDFFRNIFENGGYAALDNIDIEGYTNPLKYFAEDGKNIRYELPIQYVPSESTSTKMNSGQKNKQKVSGQSKGLKEDSIAENIFEIFDPSGISSWDDVHREWNNGKFNSEDIIQPLTAIPILGKIGKLPQGMKLGKDIYKSGSLLKLLKGLNIEEGVSDVYEDNIKKMGGMISDDDCLECGGKIKAEDGLNPKPLIPPRPEQIDFEMERQLPPDASYERDVRKFSWNNRDTDPEQIKLDSSYMLYKKPKGYSNVYNKGKLIGYTVDNKILIPGEPNFQNGGIVKAWIQKFSNGGYIADGGFPAGQELTQPTTNYYNWGNYNNSFSDPTALNQNPFDVNKQQMQVPMAQSNMPQNIGTNYKMDFNASNDEVNKGNAMADSMMGGKKGTGISNPMSMGMDVAGKSMNTAANLMSTFGKDNSKAKAFGLGASGAMKVSDNITKPFESIPIAGKAISAVGKTLGFIIGGALEARRQGIENEEMDKYNKVQEYTSRNMQTIQQPSYYGQYMSKYGSNIKNLEQRIMDDIFSDFDKYMKLT